MSRMRRAFTLIELLVVIAIIAILAAILFPVFAQARQAARGASSQSNLKQMALGVLMYSQDYDEQFPMFQSWPASGGQVCWGGCSSTTRWTAWSFDIAPYLKNAQIYADPLYASSKLDSWTQSIAPDYGYNYTTLSPYKGAWSPPFIWAGSTQASIQASANTVMLSGIHDTVEIGGYWWYGPGTFLLVGNAEPVDCGDIPSWCWTDWVPTGLLSTQVAGKYTGGNSLRKQNNNNLAFVDGHAKYMQPGQAAAGTNWYLGFGGPVHITDSTKYLWQVN